MEPRFVLFVRKAPSKSPKPLVAMWVWTWVAWGVNDWKWVSNTNPGVSQTGVVCFLIYVLPERLSWKNVKDVGHLPINMIYPHVQSESE